MNNKLNILLITADQLRKDALGCYSNPVIDTRNIDKIANDGLRFENCYTQASICAPSRASIATGRYPQSHHLYFNGIKLPENEKTFMHCFKENGYSTAAFGKMHFEPQYEGMESGMSGGKRVPAYPKPQGDSWYGFQNYKITEDQRLGPYSDYLKDHGFDWHSDIDSGDPGQWKAFTSAFPEEHYQTTWIAEQTIEHIKGLNNEPFFIWCSFVDPHHPFYAPEPFDSMYKPEDMPLPVRKEGELENKPGYQKKKFMGLLDKELHENTDYSKFTDYDWQKIKSHYYGKISLIDKNIGRIIEIMKVKGLLKNTVILITSDHGEALGDNHMLFKGPIHYDHVTNIPLIFNCPEIIKPGVVESLCQEIDIMPSILDLAGIKIPFGVQGKSLKETITEGKEKKYYDDIYVEFAGYQRVFTFRSKKWRYSYWLDDELDELYDLEEDPNQFNNVSDDSKYIRFKEEMKDRLLERILNDRDPIPERKACW